MAEVSDKKTRMQLTSSLDELEAIRDVVDELARARSLFSPMHSGHEGYAVILEELDELWTEVKARQQDPTRMYEEAKQVAAMALRFMVDVCQEEK
jgi:hypothetical protein